MIQPVPTSHTHSGSTLPGASSLKKHFEAPSPKAWAAALWDTRGCFTHPAWVWLAELPWVTHAAFGPARLWGELCCEGNSPARLAGLFQEGSVPSPSCRIQFQPTVRSGWTGSSIPHKLGWLRLWHGSGSKPCSKLGSRPACINSQYFPAPGLSPAERTRGGGSRESSQSCAPAPPLCSPEIPTPPPHSSPLKMRHPALERGPRKRVPSRKGRNVPVILN